MFEDVQALINEFDAQALVAPDSVEQFLSSALVLLIFIVLGFVAVKIVSKLF